MEECFQKLLQINKVRKSVKSVFAIPLRRPSSCPGEPVCVCVTTAPRHSLCQAMAPHSVCECELCIELKAIGNCRNEVPYRIICQHRRLWKRGGSLVNYVKISVKHHCRDHIPAQTWNTKTAQRRLSMFMLSKGLCCRKVFSSLTLPLHTSLVNPPPNHEYCIFGTVTLPKTDLRLPQSAVNTSIQKTFFQQRCEWLVSDALETMGR